MRKAGIVILALVMLFFVGCDEGKSPSQGDDSSKTTPAVTEPVTDPYKAPDFAPAEFHPDLAQVQDNVQIDLSATSQGYVALSVTSESRLKFIVQKGEAKYTYDLASDGTPSVFPLQCGNGTYTFRVMENISEKKYAEIFIIDSNVTLKDEFQPFLRPSDYVNYTESSKCVKKSRELAKTVSDELGVVGAVFDFICNKVTYDKVKASQVASGYLPDVDDTLTSGKGICFDYAALAAAMLRSQGIPTKVIFGYVSPDGLYHAWNMFYTDETGWVTVDYKVSGDSWNRLDLTFSANGSDSTFIGDGGNYTDVYSY